MFKRLVVLGIVAAFFVAPSAIAKSSSNVVKQAPAKAQFLGGHGDGQCPGDRAAAELSL